MTPETALVRDLETNDPHALRCALLRAYQAAGGDRHRAAEWLGISPADLELWTRRLDLCELVAERWPEP